MYQKLLIKIFAFLVVSLIAFGCKTTVAHRTGSPQTAGTLPPGQAKKVYGQQSAKAFAPGQQKSVAPVLLLEIQMFPVKARRKSKPFF
ncbi:hypothetical protein [Adhaeribacter pallidiroseus]|uniref:Uncharacterized protein n=1 Tax=Adhaeribacter pallidiroseus TaxID=2072847 RepID=A0A369QNK1_9BACT|nr:hypothetical protein [Adhaeribacter pallidiroseus]RDC66463.1 hypothetical protein AHMF7616_05094 [Adhaeribacter pallidiroseus]